MLVTPEAASIASTTAADAPASAARLTIHDPLAPCAATSFTAYHSRASSFACITTNSSVS